MFCTVIEVGIGVRNNIPVDFDIFVFLPTILEYGFFLLHVTSDQLSNPYKIFIFCSLSHSNYRKRNLTISISHITLPNKLLMIVHKWSYLKSKKNMNLIWASN